MEKLVKLDLFNLTFEYKPNIPQQGSQVLQSLGYKKNSIENTNK